MAGTKRKGKPESSGWRNRIVGHGLEDADQLLANPANWRVHPKAQQDALAAVLTEVGWVQDVIVNQRTGFVVDGHARVALAISRGEKVPVVYVDLDEAEEKLILATLDPLSTMAGTDKELLAGLMCDVQTGQPGLQSLLDELAQKNGIVPSDGRDTSPQLAGLEYRVIVECASEDHQAQVLMQLEDEGYKCRALIS